MSIPPISDFNRAVQAGVAGFSTRRQMLRHPESVLWQQRYQERRSHYVALTAHMSDRERRAVAAKARADAERWGIIGKAAA